MAAFGLSHLNGRESIPKCPYVPLSGAEVSKKAVDISWRGHSPARNISHGCPGPCKKSEEGIATRIISNEMGMNSNLNFIKSSPTRN